MNSTQQLRTHVRQFITGERSLDDLYDWLSQHVQELADSPDVDTRHLYGLVWLMIAEWTAGDRDEASAREDLAVEVGLLQPAHRMHALAS